MVIVSSTRENISVFAFLCNRKKSFPLNRKDFFSETTAKSPEKQLK